ncbi:MAG: class I SAM-dependent methyltransferase [Salinibacterium sp.]|nr:class I SAM-dependent methyltransferase [Salinibacterium sp.]
MSQPSPYSLHEFSVDGANDSWSNLFAFVPTGSRVLDVGCSTGNFGEALEKLSGCAVTGIDIHATDIAVARTRITRAEVIDAADPGALSALGEFDIIVFADVLEHLADPHAALIEAAACLAPRGSVLFSIPNMAHLSVRIDLLEGRFGYTDVGILDKTHVHFYDREAIERIFADGGLEIVEEKAVLIEYPPQWITNRLAAIGLSVSEEFFDLLDSTEADVLQFVGRAVPSPTGPTGETRARLRVFPPEEINAYARSVEEDNVRLRAGNSDTVDALRAYNSDLQAQLNALRERVAYIRAHPVRAGVQAAARRVEARVRRR